MGARAADRQHHRRRRARSQRHRRRRNRGRQAAREGARSQVAATGARNRQRGKRGKQGRSSVRSLPRSRIGPRSGGARTPQLTPQGGGPRRWARRSAAPRPAALVARVAARSLEVGDAEVARGPGTCARPRCDVDRRHRRGGAPRRAGGRGGRGGRGQGAPSQYFSWVLAPPRETRAAAARDVRARARSARARGAARRVRWLARVMEEPRQEREGGKARIPPPSRARPRVGGGPPRQPRAPRAQKKTFPR